MPRPYVRGAPVTDAVRVWPFLVARSNHKAGGSVKSTVSRRGCSPAGAQEGSPARECWVSKGGESIRRCFCAAPEGRKNVDSRAEVLSPLRGLEEETKGKGRPVRTQHSRAGLPSFAPYGAAATCGHTPLRARSGVYRVHRQPGAVNSSPCNSTSTFSWPTATRAPRNVRGG